MRLNELGRHIIRAHANGEDDGAAASERKLLIFNALLSNRRALGIDNDVIELRRSARKIVAALEHNYPDVQVALAEFAAYPEVAQEIAAVMGDELQPLKATSQQPPVVVVAATGALMRVAVVAVVVGCLNLAVSVWNVFGDVELSREMGGQCWRCVRERLGV